MQDGSACGVHRLKRASVGDRIAGFQRERTVERFDRAEDVVQGQLAVIGTDHAGGGERSLDGVAIVLNCLARSQR